MQVFIDFEVKMVDFGRLEVSDHFETPMNPFPNVFRLV